jgi:hypothetical protein
MDTRTLLVRCAALLTAGAALIHVGVAGPHFQEWWAAGLFFLVAAAAQLGWALWAWARPVTRTVLLAGAAGSVALVGLWAVSRTSGLPFGPGAGAAEPVGTADVVCVVLEVLSAGLAMVAAFAGSRPRVAAPRAPRRAVALTAGVAALVVLASGAALAAPSHDHEPPSAEGHTHGATTGAGHDHGETVPAAHDHHDIPNLPDTASATAQQTAAAKDLLDRTIAATAAYRDPARATAAGFDIRAAWDRKQAKLARLGKTPKQDGRGLVHVPNAKNRTDGRILDPGAPETLIYLRRAEGSFVLVGVMYTAEKKTPPTSYQPYVRWHTHERCTGGGAAKAKPVDGRCSAGTTPRTSGAMTHLWFVDDDQLAQAYAVKPPVKALLAYQEGLGRSATKAS